MALPESPRRSSDVAIDKEPTMTIKSICLITGLALASAIPASAQSNDAAYCNALVSEYQHYLGSSGSGKHVGIDQNATARVAIDKCKAGDFSGIPVLEQELRNAKLELPSRG
jgi:hypothetical protein